MTHHLTNARGVYGEKGEILFIVISKYLNEVGNLKCRLNESIYKMKNKH